MNECGFKIDSKEGPYNSGKEYENGNMGHRPPVKGGYFPVPLQLIVNKICVVNI